MKLKDILFLSLNNLKSIKSNVLWFIILCLFFLIFNVLFTVRNTLISFVDNYINNDITERFINVETSISETKKVKEQIENLNISHISHVFLSNSDTKESFDITNDKDIKGTITLYGLYPSINVEVIKGLKILNDDEMICSDNFYAGYYDNKSSSELYDMRKYLDTDFKFHTEKLLLTDDFNHHTLEEKDYSLKLVGLYNQKSNLMGYDVCYTNQNTFEKLNDMNKLSYESADTKSKYYQYMGYEDKEDLIVLVDNYKVRNEVLNILKDKGYNAKIVYEYDREYLNNMCLIVKIMTIILTVGFVIIMLIFITRTIRNDMATIALYKIIGFKNREVSKIFFLQYALLSVVSFLGMLLLSIILKNVAVSFLDKGAVSRIFTIRLDFCFSFIFLVGLLIALKIILDIYLRFLSKRGKVLKELEE